MGQEASIRITAPNSGAEQQAVRRLVATGAEVSSQPVGTGYEVTAAASCHGKGKCYGQIFKDMSGTGANVTFCSPCARTAGRRTT